MDEKIQVYAAGAGTTLREARENYVKNAYKELMRDPQSEHSAFLRDTIEKFEADLED